MAVEEGSSILQTPSYIIAVLLLLFAVLFLVFEKVCSTVTDRDLVYVFTLLW